MRSRVVHAYQDSFQTREAGDDPPHRSLAGRAAAAEIARKLRVQAGLGDEPTGVVANNGGGGNGVVDKVKDAVTP